MKGMFAMLGRVWTLVLLFPSMLYSQHRIEGRVMTIDSLPVRNAVVLLRPLDDTAQVARQLSDSLGRFSFVITPVDAVPASGQLRLDQNYPNPFAEHTTLTFAMPSSTAASLAVYDLLGRRVRALRDGPQPAGEVWTIWDGRDEIGRTVSSGMYVAMLCTPRGALSRMHLRGEVGAGAAGAAAAQPACSCIWRGPCGGIPARRATCTPGRIASIFPILAPWTSGRSSATNGLSATT